MNQALFSCKQGDGAPVLPHVNQMLGYIDYLAKLGSPVPDKLTIDLIINSLNSKFDNFRMNFVLRESDPALTNLSNLIKSAETAMHGSKPNPILMVRSAKNKRTKRGKRNKKGSRSEPAALVKDKALKPKGGVSKDDKYFACGGLGHWSHKQNVLRS